MHCHSTASQYSKIGVQRALGLPECATPPEEVYALAKRRGMQFVTITDHDTIAGVLEIAHRPDVFVSVELTAWFRDAPQAVHVLCYGITPYDHEWLQRHNRDVEVCAAYLREHSITCALAHPFYAVEAPLTARQRRRLAELFPAWETRNGARARELNMPAAIYVDTHGGTGIGGSDDHAGVDIGRTWTETPPASTPREFLTHVRAGRAQAGGDQGSAAKWAHAAMAIAARTLGRGEAGTAPDPRAVLTMVERVMREGDVRRGATGSDLGPDDARKLLRAWLDSVDLDLTEADLIAYLQDDDFRHSDLFRRARSAHERKLSAAATRLAAAAVEGGGDLAGAGACLYEACTAAIPYAPAAAFLGSEKAKLVSREGEPRRVALVADGVGSMHGVTRTLEEIRERGVPGFEVEVLGTDAHVDRRLPAVAEVEVPFYPGLEIGVPSLPALVEALAEGRYDLVHLVSPGPAGIGATLVARMMGVATVGSYHTELAAYAGMRSGDARVEAGMALALRLFYGACERVLSPSAQADASLLALGIEDGAIGRWDRGVDLSRFGPERRDPGLLPGPVNVLYAGRLTREKGAGLLVDAFLEARAFDPRLHLVLAGGGPEEERVRARLGAHATFLGWLEGDALARAYASADVFLFASRTDTFGQVILEAQASGLPVVAVAEGGPAGLVEDGVSGRLCEPSATALAAAVTELAGDPVRARRMADIALARVRGRTWERSMRQLGDGYGHALVPGTGTHVARSVA
jgi:glycosyltransferase involved in cell wall biosynthesis/predicted metal-dependent phosphoesterase TrpH